MKYWIAAISKESLHVVREKCMYEIHENIIEHPQGVELKFIKLSTTNFIELTPKLDFIKNKKILTICVTRIFTNLKRLISEKDLILTAKALK